MSEEKRMSLGRKVAGILAAGMLASACSSFAVVVDTPPPIEVRSAFVIVEARERLAFGSQAEIRELVSPAHIDKYPCFVQFVREDGVWKVAEEHGHPVDPELGKDGFSLEFEPSWTKTKPDHQVLLVVWYEDGKWECKDRELVPDGAAEYIIRSTDLTATR
jgi:hypothetical protein